MREEFTNNQHAGRMWTLHQISTALQAIWDTAAARGTIERFSKRQIDSISNGSNS